jgi:SAM-dependent methyltransferase
MSLPAWEAVAEATAIGDGTRVLDVGCGSGEFCRLAADRGAIVSGIDAAEGMIDVARRTIPGADLRVGPMELLPWGDGSFDVVTGFNAFQFAADTVVALSEARRVARPGGLVAICGWDDRYDNELPKVMAAARELLPPARRRTRPAATTIEETVLATVRASRDSGHVDVPFEAPDRPTLLRALLTPGPVLPAIEHAGEDVVGKAFAAAAGPFRRADGSYRFENRFRYLIAEV